MGRSLPRRCGADREGQPQTEEEEMTDCWSHSEGERPFTVTVYEREAGGLIYARVWDATARGGEGNWRRISLGHRDKKRAKKYAREEVPKLEQGASAISERK